MGTIADKLTYLNDTKLDLRYMINDGIPNGNDKEIDDETPFRQYVNSLFEAFLEALRNPDTLFSHLQHSGDIGESITLNNTVNAPMRIYLNYGYLTQDATPTPSSPQDIHTISGDNTISVCGKNLLDINSMVLGDLDNSTGAEVANTNKTHYRSDFIPVKPSTTYVFTTNYQVTGINKLMEYGSDKSFITRNAQSSTAKTIVFTTSANTYFFRLCMFTNPAFTDFYSLENMLEMSSSASTYQAYISQEADIDLSSKNLLEVLYNPFQQIGNGTITLSKPIEAGTYTLSISNWSVTGTNSSSRIEFIYYDNTSTEAYLNNSNKVKNITFTKQVNYVKFYANSTNGNSSGYIVTYNDLMLEKGSTKTDYVPYYEPIEYCAIGDYVDEFMRAKGYNLFDIKAISEDTSIVPSTGATESSNVYNTSDYIPVEANKDIYLRYKFNNLASSGYKTYSFYDKNKTYISGGTYSPSEYVNQGLYTWTPAQNGYIRFTYDKNAYDILITDDGNKTNYTPYGKPGEWYIKKNIQKTIIDKTNASSSAYFNNTTYSVPALYLTKPYFGRDSGWGSGYTLTNKYKEITAVASIANGTFASNFAQGYLYFFNSDFTSKEDALDLLDGTIVYIVKSTPTYTQITGTLETQLENVYQKLLSYSGTTNISQINNDLSFYMTAEAIKDVTIEE